MSHPVTARGDMHDLIAVFDSLAWKLTRQLDPGFNVAEETFVAAGANLRLDAFEQYIRGITESDQAERLRHLQQAVKLSPGFGPAWMALGREDYSGQQYEQAAAAFAKVGRDDPDALEAGFLSRAFAACSPANYAQAERAFAAVAARLAAGRGTQQRGRGHQPPGPRRHARLFRQAVTADPNAADYHFNLAVSLKRHGKRAGSPDGTGQCLKLRPNDSEAQGLLTCWKRPWERPARDGSNVDPLERIVRTFDAVAFRQAAVMLDQMEATRLAALSPRERRTPSRARHGSISLAACCSKSERLYQAAVTADASPKMRMPAWPRCASAPAIRRGARKEAQAALELKPSAYAYLVLARLDLAASHLNEAKHEAGEALKLNPNSQAAQELLRAGRRKGRAAR